MKFSKGNIVRFKAEHNFLKKTYTYVITGFDKTHYYLEGRETKKQYKWTIKGQDERLECLNDPNDILKDLCSK